MKLHSCITFHSIFHSLRYRYKEDYLNSKHNYSYQVKKQLLLPYLLLPSF